MTSAKEDEDTDQLDVLTPPLGEDYSGLVSIWAISGFDGECERGHCGGFGHGDIVRSTGYGTFECRPCVEHDNVSIRTEGMTEFDTHGFGMDQ